MSTVEVTAPPWAKQNIIVHKPSTTGKDVKNAASLAGNVLKLTIHDEDETLQTPLEEVLENDPRVKYVGGDVQEDRIRGSKYYTLSLRTRKGVEARAVLVEALETLRAKVAEGGKVFNTAVAKTASVSKMT